MEQPLFAPGDRVVCVNSKGAEPKITEGREYTIKELHRTPCCASIGVTLIEVVDDDKYMGFICVCGQRNPGKFPCFYDQKRFVPVSFDRYAEETFHQSLKGKPVNA